MRNNYSLKRKKSSSEESSFSQNFPPEDPKGKSFKKSRRGRIAGFLFEETPRSRKKKDTEGMCRVVSKSVYTVSYLRSKKPDIGEDKPSVGFGVVKFKEKLTKYQRSFYKGNNI